MERSGIRVGWPRIWQRSIRATGLMATLRPHVPPPAKQSPLERLQHADLDHQHHDDLHDGPGENLVGLNQIRSLAQPIADAARCAERLGDEAHPPAEAE